MVNNDKHQKVRQSFVTWVVPVIALSCLSLLMVGCGGGGGSQPSEKTNLGTNIPPSSSVLNEDNYAVYASAMFNSSTQLMRKHSMAGLPFSSGVASAEQDETNSQACAVGGEKVIRTVRAMADAVSKGDRLVATYDACLESSTIAEGVTQEIQGSRSIEVLECINCEGNGAFDKFVLRTSNDMTRSFAIGEGISTRTQGDMTLVIEGVHLSLESERYEAGGEVFEALSFSAFGTETLTWDYKRINDGVAIKTVETFHFPPETNYYDDAVLEGRMDITLEDGRKIVVQVLPDSDGQTKITYQGETQTMAWTDFAKLSLNTVAPTVKGSNT